MSGDLVKRGLFSQAMRLAIHKELGMNLTLTLQDVKEARNSFFDLGVYLLKSKFRIEDKVSFP